nr:MAG TPA: hypothetical protein [Caudoviricetes sp.]DAW30917.1 MAG TPA: hypothetical protein [Caudoviricetes sp.]
MILIFSLLKIKQILRVILLILTPKIHKLKELH